jgi:hypothetical protein
MGLKFEKVGHSVYVLEGDMCLGRIKKRYDGKLHFEILQYDYPLSVKQLKEIVGVMDVA